MHLRCAFSHLGTVFTIEIVRILPKIGTVWVEAVAQKADAPHKFGVGFSFLTGY
jgi:hypothetical protein